MTNVMKEIPKFKVRMEYMSYTQIKIEKGLIKYT